MKSRNVPFFIASIARGVVACGMLTGPVWAASGQPQQAQLRPKDLTAPTGTIVINGNATYTTTTAVTLTLSATDNSGTVAQMKFSNDNVTYTPPEPYATTKSWTLTSGDGTKTVYVKFADPAGNWSGPFSDTIILDTTPPVVQITCPQDQAVVGSSTPPCQ